MLKNYNWVFVCQHIQMKDGLLWQLEAMSDLLVHL